jgi:hypothetical protein
MSYWTFTTPKGMFSIVERTSRGVDLFFDSQPLGYYRDPVQAAEEVGSGVHKPLPCAPDTGKSLGVPMAVYEWTYVRR